MTSEVKCDICGKPFSNLRRAMLHMASVHPVDVGFRLGIIQTRPDDVPAKDVDAEAPAPAPEKGLGARLADFVGDL